VDSAGHRLASAETPLLDDQRRPVSQWEVGTVGRSYHRVDVPATQLPGEIRLEARAYDSATLTPLLPAGWHAAPERARGQRCRHTRAA
jgi:hypothetical protein